MSNPGWTLLGAQGAGRRGLAAALWARPLHPKALWTAGQWLSPLSIPPQRSRSLLSFSKDPGAGRAASQPIRPSPSPTLVSQPLAHKEKGFLCQEPVLNRLNRQSFGGPVSPLSHGCSVSSARAKRGLTAPITREVGRQSSLFGRREAVSSSLLLAAESRGRCC